MSRFDVNRSLEQTDEAMQERIAELEAVLRLQEQKIQQQQDQLQQEQQQHEQLQQQQQHQLQQQHEQLQQQQQHQLQQQQQRQQQREELRQQSHQEYQSQQRQLAPPQILNSVNIDPLKYLKTLPEFNGNRNDLYNFITLVDRVHPILQQYDELSQSLFSDVIKSKLKGRARETVEINFHIQSWTGVKHMLVNNFGERIGMEELYDKMRSVVFKTNTIDFYNEIKDRLRRLNNKTNLVTGSTPDREVVVMNNMKSALRIFKEKIPEPMKTILACRNPDTLEDAMEILFSSGYAYHSNKTENVRGNFGRQNRNSRNEYETSQKPFRYQVNNYTKNYPQQPGYQNNNYTKNYPQQPGYQNNNYTKNYPQQLRTNQRPFRYQNSNNNVIGSSQTRLSHMSVDTNTDSRGSNNSKYMEVDTLQETEQINSKTEVNFLELPQNSNYP